MGRDDGVNAGEFSPVFYNTWVTYSIVRVDLGPDLGLSQLASRTHRIRYFLAFVGRSEAS